MRLDRISQKISDMNNLDFLRRRLFQAGADLHDAAGIARDDGGRAGAEDVLNFPILQSSAISGCGQIIGARAAAADIRFG